jgi:hypothetical protein
LTIIMAIGSAVRSIRFENSVGDVSMDLDHASTSVEREAVADEQYEYEDIEEDDAVADNDQEEEVQGRKKSRREARDDVPFNRALPVAELPDDFDGEALDGATFLALAKYVFCSLTALH